MIKNDDQLELIPPYCPHSHCYFHFGTNERFYVKNGLCKTTKPPFNNQRFKCKGCGGQFSSNSFKIDFRRRIPDLSETILHFSMHGMSNNSIARLLEIAEGTVRDRLKQMARQSIFFEKNNHPKKLIEDIAYDGFETFTYSQFSPCYINTVVGSSSHFIYFNTFSPLNRKGRMTEEQKIKNHELMMKYGPYPRDAVYSETLYIIEKLSSLATSRTLYIDEHKAYQRALRKFPIQMKIQMINSKVRRDPSNPLFPINRLHMLYRHFLASQKRETIAFQKHEAALMEKIQLMKVYRNFMNAKFVKKIKFDPRAHDTSPAMYLGLANKILSFKEVFGLRKIKTQFFLDQNENAFIQRNYPFSRNVIVF